MPRKTPKNQKKVCCVCKEIYGKTDREALGNHGKVHDSVGKCKWNDRGESARRLPKGAKAPNRGVEKKPLKKQDNLSESQTLGDQNHIQEAT